MTGWCMHRVMEKGIIRVNWTDEDGWMKECLSKVNGCIVMELPWETARMNGRMDGLDELLVVHHPVVLII